jgi:hypothetical protein
VGNRIEDRQVPALVKFCQIDPPWNFPLECVDAKIGILRR